ISQILHSWKSFSAKTINRALDRDGVVWMEENFDTIIRDSEHLAASRDYIAMNPEKAGLPKGEFVIDVTRALLVDEQQNRPAGSPSAESGWKPAFQSRAMGDIDL